MKLFGIVLIFLLLPVLVLSQKQGNIWYFGDKAGLDFNQVPPVALLDGQTDFQPPLGWNEGSSVISDSSGALLFYTNGVKLWNKFHEIMFNGDSLLAHSSSAQSSLIVPQPSSEQYFFVFTVDGFETNHENGLRYSVVDMCLDEGRGGVISGQKNIFLEDSMSEKLACVRHSNQVDYWIISHKWYSDAFYSFKITSSGITDTVISHTGSPDIQGWGGQMIVSPNGQKISYTIPSILDYGRSMLLDFNASTGEVTNEQILSIGGREWGTSFSPDNSKLYFSTSGIGNFFQYDLNQSSLEEIIASRTEFILNGPDSWRHHQLGPDGRIYVARAGRTYLSTIEFPDSLYPALTYIDSSVYLGGRYSSWGLPNFITNFDYSNTKPSCLAGLEGLVIEQNKVIVYPIPCSNFLTVDVASDETVFLLVYNAYGFIVAEQQFRNSVTIDTSNLSSGVYFYKILLNNHQINHGKIIKEAN